MKIDSMDATMAVSALDNSPNVSRPLIKDTSASSVKVEKPQGNIELMNLSEYDKKELPLADRVVMEAIEKANKAISFANRKFEYAIHEKTKQIMIKVIDADSNEIVREIPPEKVLDMVAKMWEMAGILVDERR